MKLTLVFILLVSLGMFWAPLGSQPVLDGASIEPLAQQQVASAIQHALSSHSLGVPSSDEAAVEKTPGRGTARAALALPAVSLAAAKKTFSEVLNLNSTLAPLDQLESSNMLYKPTESSADNSEIEDYVESLVEQSANRAARNSIGAARSKGTGELPIGLVGERYCQLLSGLNLEAGGRTFLYRGTLPRGLAIFAASGLLCGVPEEAGVFQFTATAISPDQRINSARFELSIQEDAVGEDISELALETSSLAPATVGEQYTAQLRAVGGTAPYTWEAVGVPEGFVFDSRAGILSGIPTTPAVYLLNVSVQDLDTSMQSRALTLEVRDAPLAITSKEIPAAIAGVEYSFAFSAIGGVPPYNWQLVAAILPEGLRFNSLRGALEGTAKEAAQSLLRVRVVDGVGSNDELALSFRVSDAIFSIRTDSIPQGVPGAEWLLQFEAQGGEAPLEWSIVGAALPDGISLSSTGLWSGVPQKQAQGSVSVMVVDAGGQTAQSTIAWEVVGADLEFETSVLVAPLLCFDYSAELNAFGGTPPYSFELQDGTLPAGIVLSSAGNISGYPEYETSSSFVIRLTDAVGSVVQKSFLLDVQQASLETAFVSAVISGRTGAMLEYDFVAKGGCPPFSWSFQYQSWVKSLELSSAGHLKGIPSKAGEYPFTAFVRDSLGDEAQGDLRLVIAEGELELISQSLAFATAGQSYAFALEAVGGNAPYSFSLLAGSLPSGVSLDAAGGALSGVPQTAGDYDLVLEVTDSGSNRAQRSFVFSVRSGVLEILTSAIEFESAEVGQLLSVDLRAQGGEGSYVWQSNTSELGDWGLQITPAGKLTGIPSKSGVLNFNVLVEDAAAQSATKPIAILVRVAALTIVSEPLLEEAVVGEYYSIQLSAAGGVLPYAWFVQDGSLPQGLLLDSLTARIEGAPEVSTELQQLSITVSDEDGVTATRQFLIGVRQSGLAGVQGLTAVPSDSKVGLVWHNPKAEGFVGVQVLRSLTAYPTSLSDGELVYQGDGFHLVDYNVQNGEKHYYSAVALYADGSHVEPGDSARASVLPQNISLSAHSDPFVDSVVDYQPLDSGNCYGCSRMPEVVLGFPKGGTLGAGSDDVVSLHAKVNADGGRSAPYGGSIVLRFSDNIVVNGSGVDFTIFENAFQAGVADELWIEPAVVDVSVDGITYYRFPFDFVPHYDEHGQLNLSNRYCYAVGFAGVSPVYSFLGGPDPRNPAVSGGDSFDLSSISGIDLKWIQYIRITSTGDGWLRDTNGDLVRHSHQSPSWGASATGNSGFDLDAICAVNY